MFLPDGAPAIGATVLATHDEPSDEIPTGVPDHTTTTTDDGTFTFEDVEEGTFSISALWPGLPARAETIPAGRTDVRLKLGAAARVTGTVRDRARRPIADYVVSMFASDEEGGEVVDAVRVHDPSGTFAMEGLPPGRFHLKVLTAAGATTTRLLSLASGHEVSLDLTAEIGIKIVGRLVRDESGAPVSGVRIDCGGGGRWLTTHSDAGGSFQLDGFVPGEMLSFRMRPPRDQPLAPQRRAVTISAGENIVDLGVIRLGEGRGGGAR